MLSSHCGRVVIPGVLFALLIGGTDSSFGEGEAEALSASFRKASQQVLPAVVSVRPIGGVLGPFPLRPLPPPGGFVPGLIEPGVVPGESGGSGVVIDSNKGFVLTNDHVVRNASRVVVVLHDGRERTVGQVRRDPKSDLALLILDDIKGLTQAEWGDSDALGTGDWVLAIGRPFGRSHTVTAGIVSGTGRAVGAAMYEDLIQTDAAINLGNSGGPLVNLKGQVVGISTAIPTRNGGFEGVGCAVPASRARRVATDLAQHGRVRRAYLGVQIVPVDRATAERLDQPGAVAVNGVTPDGPAAAAGLRRGDIIVGFQGKPVGGAGALLAAIEVAEVGKPLTLTIDREGERRELTMTPREQPESFSLPEEPRPRPLRRLRDRRIPPRPVPPPNVDPPRPTPPGITAFPELGLHLIPGRLTINRPGGREMIQGLAIFDIDPESAADRAGLERDMDITDVAGRPVKSLDEFRSALVDRPKGQDLEIRTRLPKGGKAEFRVRMDLPESKDETPKPEPVKEKEEPSP